MILKRGDERTAAPAAAAKAADQSEQIDKKEGKEEEEEEGNWQSHLWRRRRQNRSGNSKDGGCVIEMMQQLQSISTLPSKKERESTVQLYCLYRLCTVLYNSILSRQSKAVSSIPSTTFSTTITVCN